MTRNLPWNRASTKAPTFRTSVVANTTRSRRPRPKPVASSDLDDEAARGIPAGTRQQFQAREPSTSPPPEAPEESFMEEGFDHDDRYRMVEDEFLDAAKDFTRHLHAQEYVRMKKAAKFQNAAAISSISRPVTLRMPDQTKRKVDSISRSKKQAAALKGLPRKPASNSDTDDDSDGRGNAWLGTALHGLMESPRKSSAPLPNLGTFNASTRSAAGFQQSSSVRPARDPSTLPPQTQQSFGRSSKFLSAVQEYETDSSDDGDLDAQTQVKEPFISHKVGHSNSATRNAASTAAIGSRSVLSNGFEAPLEGRKQTSISVNSVTSMSNIRRAQDKVRSDERRERLRKTKAKLDERARKKPKEEISDEIPIFL